MNKDKGYIEKNRELWNQRTAYHVQSDFYDVKGFLAGASSLNDIELSLLGDVSGKSILHLQCHFGQDTLSLARAGATVTGVDLSDKAIEKARELASHLNLPAEFICCDLYDLPAHLHQSFDLVFTSYGTIGWLPDLDKWAAIIAQYTKPGGHFVIVEFHPASWMFDNDFKTIAYSYFKSNAIIEAEEGTYADTAAPIKAESVSWNHSIGEVFQSLKKAGLTITDLKEYDYSPYPCFKGAVAVDEKKFIIQKLGAKFPLVYSLVAVR
jgi:SAM-dependent methyltransferase